MNDTKTEKEIITSSSLNNMLEYVYEDFRKYVEGCKNLCALEKDISFYNFNYNNLNAQQLYILKYAYAYAFECKCMYNFALNDYLRNQSIRVESVGCGCGVDQWALKETAKEQIRSLSDLSYIGVDNADWRYRFHCINSLYINKSAGEHFGKKEFLDSDIYVFSKSIGDFPNKDFLSILSAFEQKQNIKDKFFVLASFRKNDRTSTDDIERFKSLINSIKRGGYFKLYEKTADGCDRNIVYSNHMPEYPWEIKLFMDELESNCESRDINCDGCMIEKQNVMRRAKYLSWRAVVFERI